MVIKFITKERFFSFLLYLTVFLFALYPYRDYDWGWHYRYGEHLIKTLPAGRQGVQILRADPFSWTMEGYKWINHSWLYDPIQYLLFNKFSFLGLSFLGAFVTLLVFYIGTKPYKLAYWQKGILAIFFVVLTSGVVWQGLRSQVIGLLLLAILIWLLVKIYKNYNDYKNYKFYIALPFLFLLWANLHGTFTLGLLIFAVFLISSYVLSFRSRSHLVSNLSKQGETLQKGRLSIPKQLIWLTLSFLASFAVTFINPFTYHPYLEAARHLKNPLLPYIIEWTPAQFPSSFYNVFLAYSLFLAVGAAIRRKLTDLPHIIIAVLIFYLAFGARRYNATYVVATLPFAAAIFAHAGWRLERFRVTSFFFLIAVAITLEIGLFRRLPQYQIFSQSYQTFCDHGSKCSEGLTSYLLENPPQGRGLNFYDWGGYLIGRGVPAKLFIDGRMHLWTRGDYQVFTEYQKMYYEEDWDRFNQYSFDWVIAEPNSKVIQKIKTGELGDWETKYEDERAVYFVRK